MRNPAIVVALSALLCSPAAYSQRARTASATPLGARLNHQPLRSLAPPGTRAVVLFFVASDCPVSNRTFPEMKRLRDTFTPQGVRFWYVYPNFTERSAAIARHQRAFDPAADPLATTLTDPTAGLTRLTQAVVTPEAAILVPDPDTNRYLNPASSTSPALAPTHDAGRTAPRSGWRTIYAGRIDDRFLRIGVERPTPTKFPVAEALNALLATRPIPLDPASPVGCTILPAQKN